MIRHTELICLTIAMVTTTLAGCHGESKTSGLSKGKQAAVQTVVPVERYADISNRYAGHLQARVTAPGEAIKPLFLKGKLATRALTCVNPDCPGVRESKNGIFLFVGRYKNVRQGPNGEPIWPKPDIVTATPCPACRRDDTVFPYVPPETEKRMEQLRAELTITRRARADARKDGHPVSQELRSPAEIMHEMENLPQVFIIQEDP